MMADMTARLREGHTHMTDAALLAHVRAGDRHAFDELTIRHYRAAYRAARAIVRSHLDAEDTVQDAFVQAYVRLNSFRGDSAFATWLIAITRNKAITRLRSQRRYDRTTMPDADALASHFVSRESSPEQIVLDLERRRHLTECIDALPATLRDTLRLASSGQHSYKEIAAMLGRPTGTIKSRVSIARRIVAGRLQSRHERATHLDNYEDYRR
jgi:RNA polymerase sigma-70 factor (ECF subfamily)